MPQLLTIGAAIATSLLFTAGCSDATHSSSDPEDALVDVGRPDAIVPDERDVPSDSRGIQLIWNSYNRGVPVYPEAWHSGPLGVKTVAVEQGFVDVIKPLTECGGRRHVFRSSLGAGDKDQLNALAAKLAGLESVSASCGCLSDCEIEQVQVVTDAGATVIAGSPTLRDVLECPDQATAALIPADAVALADALRQQADSETSPGTETIPPKIRLGRIIPPDGVFPSLAATEWPFPQIGILTDISDVERQPYIVDDPALVQQIWEFFDRAEATWPPDHECERGLFVTVSAGGDVANIAASPFLGDLP